MFFIFSDDFVCAAVCLIPFPTTNKKSVLFKILYFSSLLIKFMLGYLAMHNCVKLSLFVYYCKKTVLLM